MGLTTLWFIIIAFFWVGYLVLEGFDFGVGILLPILGRNDIERRVILNTIGPVWDGNEVWLIVAGGATFAAFPEWYATLFSGFYIPLFLILVGLIIRAVGIEYRGKRDGQRWRQGWDVAIFIGSLTPAVLWAIALANIVHGVPIDQNFEYAGTLLSLLNGYALLAAVTVLALFMTHGAVFIALKTAGDVRRRANRVAIRVGVVAVTPAVLFIGWTASGADSMGAWILGVLSALAFVASLVAVARDRDGWAFFGTAVTIGLAVMMLFTALFPDVMPSSLNSAWSLTTTNAASTPYTLHIMTWVALVFTPLVLLYQSWSYWVFRKRISTDDVTAGTPGSSSDSAPNSSPDGQNDEASV